MTALKNVFTALIPLFMLALTFTACEKEDLDELESDAASAYFTDGAAGENDCFTIVYPVELNFEDGTMTTVNSDEELEDAINAWFEAQGEDAEEPSPTYPVAVILEDGMEQTLNDDEELEDLFEMCYGDDDDDEYDDDDDEHDDCFEDIDFTDCFTINYPIDMLSPDGSTTTINNDEELEAFLESFEDDDDDDEEGDDEEEDDENEEEDEDEDEDEDDFEVVYPISVTMVADGAVVTLNNDDEIEDLLEDCE